MGREARGAPTSAIQRRDAEPFLAHLIGPKQHRSYNEGKDKEGRDRYLEQKREILAWWDKFLLSGKLKPGEIVKYQKGGAPIVSDDALVDETHRRVQAGEGVWEVVWELAERAEYRGKRGNPIPTEEAKRMTVAKRLYFKYGRKYGYHGKQRAAPSMRAKGLYTIRGTIELLRDLGIHATKDTLHNAIRTGTLTAKKAPNGVYEIPLSELQRVYPELIPTQEEMAVAAE